MIDIKGIPDFSEADKAVGLARSSLFEGALDARIMLLGYPCALDTIHIINISYLQRLFAVWPKSWLPLHFRLIIVSLELVSSKVGILFQGSSNVNLS